MISIPSGVVLTSEWLGEQGVSSKLAWWYVRIGLLERLGTKAYKKAGDHVTWVGAVAALQNQKQLSLHVGGKTALQLLGRSHFISMQGVKQVMLFADLNTRVPSWVVKKDLWDVEFEIFRTSLFDSKTKVLGVIERPIEGITLRVSCPEMAAMEALYLVPKYQSIEEIALLLEGLGQLRPNVVQSLLEGCHSIKVKRLFLYFSEKFQHTWLEDLDLKKINLGHGKRVIGSGGKYDANYLLSLPEMKDE